MNGFDRTRSSPFSYTCHACSKCCVDKVIRTGPYETLRLAEHLQLSTTELLARYTEAGGTVLQTKDDNSCVFLHDGHCSVHPARPLACRLYPLTWRSDGDGNEEFGVLPGHPESAGQFGEAADVEAYLQAQGVAPYLAMLRRYIQIHDRLLRALERELEALGSDADELPAPTRVQGSREGIDRMPPGSLASHWLDVHRVVREYVAARGGTLPTSTEEWVEQHIAALEHWLASREP